MTDLTLRIRRCQAALKRASERPHASMEPLRRQLRELLTERQALTQGPAQR